MSKTVLTRSQYYKVFGNPAKGDYPKSEPEARLEIRNRGLECEKNTLSNLRAKNKVRKTESKGRKSWTPELIDEAIEALKRREMVGLKPPLLKRLVARWRKFWAWFAPEHVDRESYEASVKNRVDGCMSRTVDLLDDKSNQPPRNSMDFTLEDSFYGDLASTLRGRVSVEPTGQLLISLEGYGDCDSVSGKGTPVMLEVCRGEPRLVIWGDINAEDPTSFISLQGAKETARKPEQGDPE